LFHSTLAPSGVKQWVLPVIDARQTSSAPGSLSQNAQPIADTPTTWRHRFAPKDTDRRGPK
jgi:hypothetical protein